MRTISFIIVLCWACGIQARVLPYPRTADAVVGLHSGYRVFVKAVDGADDWQELAVYQVEVDGDTHQKAAMAHFDMSAPVEVKVEHIGGMCDAEVIIRPLARRIVSSRQADGSVHFIVDVPAKLSVEFGGDRLHNLHLFANPEETETYTADAIDDMSTVNWNGGTHDIFRKGCRLIYFGPGVHAPKDLPNNEISIPSNCTVYLAPGAVVKARLRVDHAHDVRIIGRGMLYQPLRGVEITFSRNVLVEGITVVNPTHYTILGGNSENVTIRNVKSFSSKPWSDGIDLMSCRDWTIEDVFLRTSDDCLAFYNHRWWYWGDSKNITVDGAVLWADVAHAIHVGSHGDDLSKKGETISRVTFRNIDVLNVDEDDDNYRGVMAISCGDKNRVRDVLFENIRVEDCEEARLFDLRVNYNEKYNRAPGRSISGITFRNITYTGEKGFMAPSRILGYSSECGVNGVIFDNVWQNGVRMIDTKTFQLNDYVKGVQVR